MARILLGVSGGIAAYKALELARLATMAGHGVRVLMTERATPLRRRRLLRGHRRRPGADLRVRARPAARRLPRRSRARARPDRPPRARRQLRRLPGRPGLGQHDRQARRRHRRLDAHHLLPRLHGAAPGRAGDERPHVRRRGDPGQPGDPARARRRGDRARGGRARLARRARQGPAARPGRPAGPGRSRAAGGRAPLGRPAGPGHRGRHPRADRPGALPRQPLQRPHGHRPRRGGRPPRRRRDPDRRQRRPARAGRRPPHRRGDRAQSWPRPPEPSSPEPTSC